MAFVPSKLERMKATELRIGNLVYPNDENATPWEVMGVLGHDKIYFGSTPSGLPARVHEIILMSSEQLQPIPLNEEWLQNCGFEKSNDTIGGWLSPVWGENQEKFRILGNDGSPNVFYFRISDDGQPVVLLYIHQLQNFFHAVTGDELNIR